MMDAMSPARAISSTWDVASMPSAKSMRGGAHETQGASSPVPARYLSTAISQREDGADVATVDLNGAVEVMAEVLLQRE